MAVVNLMLITLPQSTLLQCLLGELKPVSGKVEVKGRLSYVSQEPWMFMGTIRDNILFGMPYDSAWYNKVVEACSLDEVKCSYRLNES